MKDSLNLESDVGRQTAYCKIALASIQQRPNRAIRSARRIALQLIPVLLAAGLSHEPATARPESATLRPVFERAAPAFLVVVAAITFLSAWAKVRPRNYEIGILRFLGASKSFAIAVVSAEAALVSGGGALLGVAISQALLALTPYSIGWKWCVAASFTVISAAIAGSAIPCAVSLQQDVIKMLERDR